MTWMIIKVDLLLTAFALLIGVFIWTIYHHGKNIAKLTKLSKTYLFGILIAYNILQFS